MDVEKIKELNREVIESGSVLLSIPEDGSGALEYSTESLVPDLRSLFNQSPMLISAAVFIGIIIIAYLVGLNLRPEFLLVQGEDNEVSVNRNKLAVVSIAVAILTVAVLNYYFS